MHIRRFLLPYTLMATVGCGGAPSAPTSSDAAAARPAPSFLDPTTKRVSGHACSFTAAEWSDGRAAALLDDRFGDVAPLAVGGVTLEDAAAYRALAHGGGADVEPATLALNLAMNDAGVFGVYADLGSARLRGGDLDGIGARPLLDGHGPLGDLARDGAAIFNGGFAGCDADWFLTCHTDADHDGIPQQNDCDDGDPTVGTLLLDDDLATDDGIFSPTPQLDTPWAWTGDAVVAVEGGQQAMLGPAEAWDDVVVVATISALGTEPGCGYDCMEACGDYVPDDCYTDWQALGLGILGAETTDAGVITFTNGGAHDICFDGFLSWDSPDSQGITVGEELLDAATYRLPAGGTLDLYYGSWTTANGVFEPFLDDPPFWCFQAGASLDVGDVYTSVGGLLPEDMQEIIAGSSDADHDGIEDHVEWYGIGGVKTQYDVWAYQDDHAALSVGKLAASTATGTVETTLTVQNRGALSATGTVTDSLPRDWRLVACSDAPDAEVLLGDGTTELTWAVALDGCTNDCAVVDEVVITCDIAYALHVDLDIVELPAASVAYHDGDDDEVSWSMPAAAFDYDHDGDGQVLCGETDRWRAGVLVRAALDADQDEGFHGYRCALARNDDEGCHDAGHFLQIAEFEDAAEDGIQSECDPDCGPNSTFVELARTDHGGVPDLAAQDVARLTLWAVGQDLVCTAEDDASGTSIEARAEGAATSFATGTVGMSTLNMFGVVDAIRVCEAYATP